MIRLFEEEAMPIVVNLDVMMAKRKMSLNESSPPGWISPWPTCPS